MLDYDPSDFEYVISALANLKMSYPETTIDEIYQTVLISKNGKQFDAGISSVIKLKDLEECQKKN